MMKSALPLSDDKQHQGCTDQNKKSRAGRCNAYLFEGLHDAPPQCNITMGKIKNPRFPASPSRDRHIHRINFMRVEFSPADGPKPDSLALRPALVDLGPASRSIRQFGLEDQMPFRPGLPQASDRLWIARTQEPSPPDARNTACQSLYFPRGMPPAPTPLRRNWTFVPNRKYKSELKGEGVP